MLGVTTGEDTTMQSTTDSNGNPVNPRGVPTGPVDHRPSAAYDSTGRFKDSQAQEEILMETLNEAGVELGAYDRRLVGHLAKMFDWEMTATVASWIVRSRTD